jgi:uncharacterized membrane protein
MLAKFSVRFVVAVFLGAAVGLLVGLIGRSVFDASWNPITTMAWGIMAGALVLAFRSAMTTPGAGTPIAPDP